MRKKRFHCVVALLCVITLLVSSVPCAAANTAPTLRVADTTIAQDGTGYISVYLENVTDLRILEFYLTYDSSVLSMTDYYCYSGTMDAISVSEETDGQLSVKAMDLDGLNTDSSRLLLIYFDAAADAELGEYPMSLSVSRAVNSSMVEITMEKSSGAVTIKKKEAPRASFYCTAPSSVEAGEEVKFILSAYSVGGMVTGQFSFSYDSDLFGYQSAKAMPALEKEDCLFSVNNQNPGLVMAAWAAGEAASSGNLIELTLRAKENVTDSCEILCQPGGLFNGDHETIQFSPVSASVTVTEKSEEENDPDFRLVGNSKLRTDETISLTAMVEGRSGLAAADFTINYDPNVLTCVQVQKAENTSDEWTQDSIMIMINDKFDQGVIRFSMLYPAGITQDTELIELQFRAANNAAADTEVEVAVRAPVDSDSREVQLEIVPKAISVVVPKFQVTFCDDSGTVLKTQSVPYLDAAEAPELPEKEPTAELHFAGSWSTAFDKIVQDTTVTAVYEQIPHTKEHIAAIAPTCTETGLTEGERCSGCALVFVEQEVVSATGHTDVVDAAIAPTCTETGLTEGKHCSVCNEVLVAQNVIDALGHVEAVDGRLAL